MVSLSDFNIKISKRQMNQQTEKLTKAFIYGHNPRGPVNSKAAALLEIQKATNQRDH